MKKLYSVEITFDLMVMSSDEDEAERVASKSIPRIVKEHPGPTINIVKEVKSEEELGPEFTGTIPYGVNPLRLTCNEILSQGDVLSSIKNLTELQKDKILSLLDSEHFFHLMSEIVNQP